MDIGRITMGEAKRRGTFEQRKAEAIERQRIIIKAWQADIVARKPMPQTKAAFATWLTIALAEHIKDD